MMMMMIEIRVIVKLRYQSMTKYCALVLNILRVTYFLTSITMPDPQTSDMRHI